MSKSTGTITITIPIPSAASPAAFFDKSVGTFRAVLTNVLRDQLIGKVLNRPSDLGMFAYDVVERYPDLEEAYMSTCPSRMDFGTMQKTIQRYVEGIPAAVMKAVVKNKALVTVGEGDSESSCLSDFVVRCHAAAESSVLDVPYKDIVVSTAVALITSGHMHPETGGPTGASALTRSPTPLSSSLSSMPLKVAGKVQTRPKANFPSGGKAVEPSPPPSSVAYQLISAAVGGGDPLVTPPSMILQWFLDNFISPALSLIHSDVNLICENCCQFNANNPDTTYVDTAASLREFAVPALSAMSVQLQTIFAKWWKASGVWKAVTTEVSRVKKIPTAPAPPPTLTPPAQGVAAVLSTKIRRSSSTSVISPSGSVTELPPPPPRTKASAAAPSTTTLASEQHAEDDQPVTLLANQPTRRSINFSKKGAAASASLSQGPNHVESSQEADTVATSQHDTSRQLSMANNQVAPNPSAPVPVPPHPTAALQLTPVLAATQTKPQPSLRETYPHGRLVVPTSAPTASNTTGSVATGQKIQLSKMAAFEEMRRAEKKRLLELLASRQASLAAAGTAAAAANGGGSCPSSTAAAASSLAATTIANCPRSLAYAIPDTIRVNTVLEHLHAKNNALAAAEKFRDEALSRAALINRETEKSAERIVRSSVEERHMHSAAVLLSVFGAPDTTPPASPADHLDCGFQILASAEASSGDEASESKTKEKQSALETLSTFYLLTERAAQASLPCGNNSSSNVQARPNNNETECSHSSVTEKILRAYNQVQLGELRELLTLIAGALHKATTDTPVLFYGHELALWYWRQGSMVASAAASRSCAPSSLSSCAVNIGLKRERMDGNSESTAGDSQSVSHPSFWVKSCFATAEDSEAALRTARLLSTKMLVRMLLWFPHIVAACAKSAVGTNQTTRTFNTANGKQIAAEDTTEANAVSLVISGAVACPAVERLLAFISSSAQRKESLYIEQKKLKR